MNDLLNRFWINDANCHGADPVQFFPPSGASHTIHNAARRLCAACPVEDECLAYRLVTVSGNSDDGIWGGTIESERRTLTRMLGLARKPSDVGTDWRQFVGRVGEAARAVRTGPARQDAVA